MNGLSRFLAVATRRDKWKISFTNARLRSPKKEYRGIDSNQMRGFRNIDKKLTNATEAQMGRSWLSPVYPPSRAQ